MENKQNIDEWAKEALPILRQNGYLDQTITKVLRICFIVMCFFLCFIFLYGINSGAFKSEINQSMQCPNCICPTITIPTCPTPNLVCNNTCVYPNNMSIKLTNITI